MAKAARILAALKRDGWAEITGIVWTWGLPAPGLDGQYDGSKPRSCWDGGQWAWESRGS